MSVEIRNNAAASLYELRLDGQLAATASYVKVGDQIVFPHTVTAPQFRGRGLAGQLVQKALEDARADDLTVVPECWFVAQYIDEHPEFSDLVAAR